MCVICVCLVFLSVGDLLHKQITNRQEPQTRTGGIVTAQSTAEEPLKMVVKKDRNM